MLEDIRELDSEAKPHLLFEMKFTLEGDVCLRGSEAAQYVTSEVALLSTGRPGEGCLVENLGAWILGAVQFKGQTFDYVRPPGMGDQ